ncbi:MAG: transglycosylase domain-containing protein [Candidatus Pacebacteria bacterium]|nr:transglycosylase domain-containing protein [Candidatus Paceibacterota bacterium]
MKKYKKTKQDPSSRRRKEMIRKWLRTIFFVLASLFLIFVTAIAIYISTVNIPDFSNFANRKIDNSTQIYDRTGKILLYDVHGEVKRTQVSSSEISQFSKDATIAIEDKHFYEHKGIRPTSIIRAMIANLKAGSFVQGGSTIDQQVIKNALLTREKSIIRKITEWAMAIKLDSQVSKEDILTIYLNDAAFGGTIYGIQTASKFFFNKDAADLTLAEAAYLAALPNAPSYYSPYGTHIDELEERKNLILKLMLEQEKISPEQYSEAKAEKVVWQKNSENGKAMHFVFYVRDYLEQKYGKDVVDKGGFKVITTLDYDLQSEGENIVNKYALENAEKYQATNAALVAIDPRTGQILTMVGSRDYFEVEAIPGNFNAATAPRQPGSAFKPIVYATAFMEGYTPETVLFDVPTQFSTTCYYDGTPLPGYSADSCYFPSNYDGDFRGPVTIREALAQSLNIPAVKTLYLVGVKNAISTAQKLGITTLDMNGNYGLSLVLGSGETSLLQLTNAYGVFANGGIYNPPAFILSITDIEGNVLEEYKQNNASVIPSFVAGYINSILSDNNARAPLYGYSSGLYFPGKAVAAKTGTTNEYRDTWTIGYSPSIAVGVWAGNNDNSKINKGMSGMVAVPMWNEFMSYAVKDETSSSFKDGYQPSDLIIKNTKPPVNGLYCYTVDGINYSFPILEENDSQYTLWKIPSDLWMQSTLCPFTNTMNGTSTNASSSPLEINGVTTTPIINLDNNIVIPPNPILNSFN